MKKKGTSAAAGVPFFVDREVDGELVDSPATESPSRVIQNPGTDRSGRMNQTSRTRPLAARLRPSRLSDVLGQDHLVGPEGAITRMIASGRLGSMVLWGPPGVGKTTIALLIADAVGAEYRVLSAVSAGIKEVRAVIHEGEARAREGERLVLFLDEIHRFNKTQQDALLPAVEEGSITLIGATTENPSFSIISPLLSRLTLFVLEPLAAETLTALGRRAAALEPSIADLPEKGLALAARLAGGDGRKYLTGLELVARTGGGGTLEERIREAFASQGMYDRDGEAHYDIISAFIKSIRGSDPDAALFWGARMLRGGEDPLFIARRLIILSSEDIGNADPYALTLATNTYLAIERIGMPEGRIVLGQCITYLASTHKSNASYNAINAAMGDAERHSRAHPPLHLRNAQTPAMKSLGYGKDYLYAHDHPGAFVDQNFFPEEVGERRYYHPSDRGREATFAERLRAWWPRRSKKA